ncbi:MAG: Cof-type HAD-IIB family hydrolase [Fusobacteriaceae bacterium]
MEIKVIATDIDGTLVNSAKEISKETKEYLNLFVKKGGKVILSTGRTYFSAKKIVENLNIYDIVVAYNGAMIVNSKNDEILYHLPLDGEIIKELINISRKYNIHLNLYQNDKWFVENLKNIYSIEYSKNCGKDAIEKNFDNFETYEMTKALYIGEPSDLKKIELEIKKRLGKKVHITYSKPTFLEVLNKDVNKGEGLKKVLLHYNISEKNAISFGDELNDLEMLQLTKYGVVMGNANPELKKMLIHETFTNEEDGLIKFIKEISPLIIKNSIFSEISKIRTHRSFEKEEIQIKKLKRMIEGARLASSAKNAQELRYVIINNKEIRSKIFTNINWAGSISWNPEEEEAPGGYILICSKKKLEILKNYLYFDMGLATQNILLVASEEGYNGCILGNYNKKEIEKIINLNENYESHILIALGKSKDQVKLVPGKEGKTIYYRKENINYVPKLLIENLILDIK